MGKVYVYDPGRDAKSALSRKLIGLTLALKNRGYGDEEVNEFMEILLDLDLHPTQSEREYYERLIGGIILAAGTMDLDVIRDKFGSLDEGDAA